MSSKKFTSLINVISEDNSTKDVIRQLKIELMTLKRMGVKKVKILHGQGLSSDGLNISNTVRAELKEQVRADKIKYFCPGEVFGPFEREGRQITDIDSSFREDEDWSKSNSKVTLVSL